MKKHIVGRSGEVKKWTIQPCDVLLKHKKIKNVQNILDHCEEGRQEPFENKAINIARTGISTRYMINYEQHEKIEIFSIRIEFIEQFLKNIKERLQPTKYIVSIKCSLLWCTFKELFWTNCGLPASTTITISMTTFSLPSEEILKKEWH